MKTFWVVVKDKEQLQATHRHPSFEDASAEAKRLAEANPGCTFFIMEAVGYWRPSVPPVIYEITT